MTFQYQAPAAVNDFQGHPDEVRHLQDWSNMIQGNFEREISRLRDSLGQEPLFFSEAVHAIPGKVLNTPVPWNGFPRVHELLSAGNRQTMLTNAEQRGVIDGWFTDSSLTTPAKVNFRKQDEYLEWVPVKQAGKVVRFAFTAEGPEYWEFLANADRTVVLGLYEDFCRRKVPWSEISWGHDVWTQHPQTKKPLHLYSRGDYNPYNSVNLEECAAHLTHPANTLGAEINLAARATVQRIDRTGSIVTERRRLACCSNFGDPNRNSDPVIGAAVNQTVQGGISLTLANPVGLYIRSFDDSRVADSKGNALPGWWKPVRGHDGQVLRAEFGPPDESPLSLDDVRVGNNEILSAGGQLAELTNMVIYARALNLGVSEPQPKSCVNRCCVKQGKSPEKSLLMQTKLGDPCSAGWKNAFEELASSSNNMNPFVRRETMGHLLRATSHD